MYKVVADFKDLRDGGYEYKAGDVYPREGIELVAERVQTLSTPTTGRGALIAEASAPEPVSSSKSKSQKKREAIQKGAEDAD